MSHPYVSMDVDNAEEDDVVREGEEEEKAVQMEHTVRNWFSARHVRLKGEWLRTALRYLQENEETRERMSVGSEFSIQAFRH